MFKLTTNQWEDLYVMAVTNTAGHLASMFEHWIAELDEHVMFLLKISMTTGWGRGVY